MAKKKKIFWYTIIGLFFLMQIYPVTRPEVIAENPNDLLKNVEVPENISSMLRSACYDCHSNETIYPWYASIAPVKWIVYDHTEEGREDLNFSEWNALSKSDRVEALDDIIEEVTDGKMPLRFYPLTHKDAKLDEEDRQELSDWAESLMEEMF